MELMKGKWDKLRVLNLGVNRIRDINGGLNCFSKLEILYLRNLLFIKIERNPLN